MNCKLFLPQPHLKKYIRYFWAVDHESSLDVGQEINTIVDDSSGIIFQHYNGNSSFTNQAKERVKIALVYGKHTTATKSVSDMPFSATGINFTSQGLKLVLGIDAQELTNCEVGLDEIYSRQIVEQLLDQKDQAGRVSTLESFLSRQIDRSREEDKLVLDCCSRIKSGQFNVHITDLSKHYRISERQLERRFHHAVGMSPKFYMRMIRFQHAMRHILSGEFKNLGEVAYEFGYSDQSRMISDARDFTNYTPKQLMQHLNSVLLLEEM